MIHQRPISYPFALSTALKNENSGGIKWKNLTRFSKKKWQPSKRSSQLEPYSSPTVIAAATEKYIRKKTTESTIQSEDLTCSQFAFMAGIKIKKERYGRYNNNHDDDDDNDNQGDDDLNNKIENENFFDTDEDEDDDEDIDEDEDENYPLTMDDRHMTILKSTQNGTMPTPPSIMTSYSTSTSSSRYQHHQIWDARFWKNNQLNNNNNITIKSKSCHSINNNNNKNDQSSHYSTNSNDTILSSYSSTNSSSCSSSSSNLKKNQSPPKIIQKGRFQIVVGDHLDQQQLYQGEPLVKTSSLDSSVVEWRRKRAMST